MPKCPQSESVTFERLAFVKGHAARAIAPFAPGSAECDRGTVAVSRHLHSWARWLVSTRGGHRATWLRCRPRLAGTLAEADTRCIAPSRTLRSTG